MNPPSLAPHAPPQAPRPADAADTLRIGVFDSGLGGLSVLRELRAALPHAALTYVADSGHAPYGERQDAFVIERSARIARHLFEDHGVQLLVVACNTATAAAVHELRAMWPARPIVGVEPGLKPAVEASRRGIVGVLATPGTLRSSKFKRLLDAHQGKAAVHLQPCPGLAGMIEKGELDDPRLVSMIEGFCAPLRQAGADVAVLGCTHYAFVAHHIARALGPEVEIIDTAQAIARRAEALARELPLALAQGAGADAASASSSRDSRPRLLTTGDPALLEHVMFRWLGLPSDVERSDI